VVWRLRSEDSACPAPAAHRSPSKRLGVPNGVCRRGDVEGGRARTDSEVGGRTGEEEERTLDRGQFKAEMYEKKRGSGIGDGGPFPAGDVEKEDLGVARVRGGSIVRSLLLPSVSPCILVSPILICLLKDRGKLVHKEAKLMARNE
jgi:hypothetical protein